MTSHIICVMSSVSNPVCVAYNIYALSDIFISIGRKCPKACFVVLILQVSVIPTFTTCIDIISITNPVPYLIAFCIWYNYIQNLLYKFRLIGHKMGQ